MFVIRVGDHTADISHQKYEKYRQHTIGKKNKLEKKIEDKIVARDLQETRNAVSSLEIRPTRTLELWTIRQLNIK